MLIGLGHIQYTFVSEGMLNRCDEAIPELTREVGR